MTPEELQEEISRRRTIGPLGKAHNIAVHTRKTPVRIKPLWELSGGVLKRHNATCWHSWNNLLGTLLRPDIRYAIEIYVDENPLLEENRLERRKWKLLEKVQRILSTFKLATKAMEGHQATLTHLLPSIDFLLNTYSEVLKDNEGNRILSSMIRMGWEKLDKYFSATDRAPVYLGAVVLNSKFKWRYFEVKWDQDWVRNGKQWLKRYWLQYSTNQEEDNRNSLESVERDHDRLHSPEQSTRSELLPDEEENQFWAWMDLRSPGGPVKDDYERYCLNSEPETSIENPLQYV